MLMMFHFQFFFNAAQNLSCKKLESEWKLEIDGLTLLIKLRKTTYRAYDAI